MIPDFSPASDIVPAAFDATRWENLELLYREMIGRELHCKNCLNRLIMDRSEVDAAASEAGSILHINMTCHTDDAAANKAYLEFVENVAPRLKESAFALDKKIAASPYASDLDQERFGVMLRNMNADIRCFRQENVPLEVEQSVLDQQYQQVCGAMTVMFRGTEHTLPQMGKYNEVQDRATREEAWIAQADRRLVDAERLDTIFDKMVDLRRRIARNAGFANYRDFMFVVKHRFDYGPRECDEFARGVEEVCTPLLRGLMAERSEVTGIRPLRPWDGFYDMHGHGPLKPFETAEQLVEQTSRVFHRMDGSLGVMFDWLRGGDGNGSVPACLDLESRKGKAPGGYQADRQRVRRPFIFMNATGLQRDIDTLVHEAGHSFHAILTRGEPLLPYRADVPTEFCEVASMSMELTAHPFYDEYYPDRAEAGRAKRQHLEQMIMGLTFIAIVDQFQHWLYTTEGSGRKERNAKWAELTHRYGAGYDWTGLERYLELGWHRVLHLFGVPLYYIEYGIAQLGALQVWSNYRRDPAGAIAAYKQGLALGGSRPLPELFEAAGVSFEFGPRVMERVMRDVQDQMKERGQPT